MTIFMTMVAGFIGGIIGAYLENKYGPIVILVYAFLLVGTILYVQNAWPVFSAWLAFLKKN
jgi:uncharacterized membrane protein YoaK (UPF0700 family)